LELRGGGDREPLLAGTYEHGYYGEVLASEFITGNQLATRIGLTAGTAFNSDAGWLKFALDYKTLYVAKRPFRYNLSWDQINAASIVYGKDIEINGKLYKVRLLKGRGDGSGGAYTNGYDILPSHNSEWNRLMYHVSGKPFANASNTLASEGITEGDWAQFSEAELLTYYTHGNGSYCWCQESSAARLRVLRGYNGVSYVAQANQDLIDIRWGWRPCLELVE